MQLNKRLRQLPPLITGQLWHAQIEAITNLEKSLAQNRPRALIQMATGSGKTFTAVNFVYRLTVHDGCFSWSIEAISETKRLRNFSNSLP